MVQASGILSSCFYVGFNGSCTKIRLLGVHFNYYELAFVVFFSFDLKVFPINAFSRLRDLSKVSQFHIDATLPASRHMRIE